MAHDNGEGIPELNWIIGLVLLFVGIVVVDVMLIGVEWSGNDPHPIAGLEGR